MSLELRENPKPKYSFEKFLVYYENKNIGYAEECEEGLIAIIEKDFGETLLGYSLHDLEKLNIATIALRINRFLFPSLSWVGTGSHVYISAFEGLSITIYPDILSWNKPISFNDFLVTLKFIFIEDKVKHEISSEDSIEDLAISIEFPLKSSKFQIGDSYNFILQKLSAYTEGIFEHTERSKDKNSLTNTFNFPPEIRSSCEQYLIYFSTFLADLGFDVDTKVEKKVHATLFTVKPNDTKTALSKIQEALNIFLKLPQSENFDEVASKFNDASVTQLISNIHHLKSQLYLAQATIQAKNTTIQNLEILNFKKSSTLEQLEENTKKEEKLFGGVVSLGTFEKWGTKINLAELLRRLKRNK